MEGRRLLAGQVLATLVHDVNGNGVKDAEEPALQGWTVFVDYNRNAILDAGEPSAVTDIDGEALIGGVPDNTWDVRQVLQPGFAPSKGFDVVERTRVRDGEKAEVLFLNAETAGTGTIQGTVWNDLDRDGVRDPGDPGIPGWTVFLDLNTDQVLNPGEPSTVTDANGFYSFGGLTSGQYRVREITPAGWDPTVGGDAGNNVDVAAGGTTVADFGNFNVAGLGTIRGTVWNDVNADGFRAAGDPGIGDWTVFLDLNGDGVLGTGEPTAVTDPAGAYTFAPVPVGTYKVMEVLKDGWNLSPGHPASLTLGVTNEGANRADFAVYTPTLGSISGRVWNDADGNGAIGAGEPGLSGWTVYIDQNSNGAADAGEPSAVTDGAGNYTITGVPIGSMVVRAVLQSTFTATAPGTGMQLVTLLNGSNVAGVNFGNRQRTDSAIAGSVYADANKNGARDAGEKGLAAITVYLDLNDNGSPDAGEPVMATSADLFYTPATDESGSYQFTHLPEGTYHVRQVVPAVLSATPAGQRDRVVALAAGEAKAGVDFGDVYRANEIHGVVFDDANKNHVKDVGEAGIGGVSVYVDVNRNDVWDAGEPITVTAPDGSYAFVASVGPGSYVVRALHPSRREYSYPTTTSGILWPTGVSNPAVGNVSPTSITTALADGQGEQHTVSLTLPLAGSLSDKVDVFLLFDDTGSFTSNSPIVRAAFPQIIAALQAALPGVDLGFGVGRFEEYANFAAENSTGRPFILNQPIVSAATPGFLSAIQSALDRMAPGYGGDQPETDIEALYQMATGRGFDGNNNGTTTDSGTAGMVSTQLTPGDSGDVPAFGSFTVDPSGNVLPPSGNIGGAGFRPGALPIILVATDTGFAFQPRGETSVTGVGGLTLPLSDLTQTSRATTPFSSGAGIQETITALNALGALVIGLGTNGTAGVDPRGGLEALAKLTGAVNRSAVTIPNGTLDPIAPGDPMYFQISSGFGTSVASGIVTAIENAVSNVSVNLTVKASDPRVHVSLSPNVVNNVGAGQTATFVVTFTGDGRPHRFDLQFVRQGTDVVLGSIPVVMGTPIVGNGYGYVELEDGEIEIDDDFGDSVNLGLPANVAPSFVKGADQSAAGDAQQRIVPAWATSISAGPASDAGQALNFLVSSDNGGLFAVQPSISPDGTLTYTPKAGASGTATVTVQLHDSGGSVGGGEDTSAAQTFTITIGGPAVLALPGANGDDAYEVRIGGGRVVVYAGTGLAATVLYDVALGSITGVSFDGGVGNDTLRLVGEAGAADNYSLGPNAGLFDGLSLNFGGVETVEADGAGGWDTLAVDGGTVAVAAAQQFQTLLVGGGGRVAIRPGGGAAVAVRALSLLSGSTLDLGDASNTLAVDYADAGQRQTILDWIKAAYAFGRWNLPGITAASAKDPAANYLIGIGFSDAPGAGTAGMLNLRAAVYGDANIDGKVTADDVATMLLSQAQEKKDWSSGNFNYDARISADDWALFGQGAAFAAAHPAPAVAASAFAAEPVTRVTDLVLSGDPAVL